MTDSVKSLFAPDKPDTSREERLLAERERKAKNIEASQRKRVKAAASAAGSGSRWKLFFGPTGERGVRSAPAPAAGAPAGRETLG